MRLSKRKLLALSLSLLAASCATTKPTAQQEIAASYPVDRTDFVPVAYGGRVGVWVSEDALGDMLAGFEKDKGALRVEIARSKVGKQLADERATAIEKNVAALQWRATYGLPLGVGIGTVGTAVLTAIIFAVVRGAALSQP